MQELNNVDGWQQRMMEYIGPSTHQATFKVMADFGSTRDTAVLDDQSCLADSPH